MTAASMFKHLSMADVCITSLPTLFTSKPSHSSLSLPAKPITTSSLIPLISLKKKQPFLPLVAQTTEWALQEEQDDGITAEGEPEGVEYEDETEESYPEPPEEAKLFVGNLRFDVESNELAQLFGKAGTVEIAQIIYNQETDRSRGFGFVTMSTVEEAEKAVEMFHQYDVGGRLLTVNIAGPRGSRPERVSREPEPSLKIYVGNLPWQVDDARLEQVFSEHGRVLNAKVVYDREIGRSRGFGFVTMASETELNDAIAALDGQNLDGRAMRVNAAEERVRRSSF